MMKKLSAIIAALLAAYAATLAATGVTLQREMPTQNVDGSVIPATGPGSIVSTTLQYGACTADGGVPAAFTEKVVEGGSVTTSELSGLIPGTEYCVRAYVTNTYGQKSGFSNIVRRQAAFPVPGAPLLK